MAYPLGNLAKVARRSSSRLRHDAPEWPDGWVGKRKSGEAGLDDALGAPARLDDPGAGPAHGITDVENDEGDAPPPVKRQRSYSTSPGGTPRRALRPSWAPQPRARAKAMSQEQTETLSPSVKGETEVGLGRREGGWGGGRQRGTRRGSGGRHG